jgi:hypothetical protein
MFSKHIKILLLSLFCLSQVALHAQEEADTSVNLNIKELEDLDWMMDTTFKVFKTKRFSNMQTVFLLLNHTKHLLVNRKQENKPNILSLPCTMRFGINSDSNIPKP